ncbi:diguanylate cyclase [Bacterioplanes sanyensis]|uniref:diguanylate cyclase domain-containing protein n=1 Tax=Bacterioplanes sanyensis TaxID=1249553 RepID=UPI0016791A77|nr:diguanylate cyclase [Bacterioplanes sanyensis]GGY35058.1 diguanylate cyclase [Bacterioplanes sanyensis]
MITIRMLSLWATLLYLILLFLGFLAVRIWWFYPQELEIVRTYQEHEIRMIHRQLEQKSEHLLAFAVDYARWDDTYEFVAQDLPMNADHRYVRTNFIVDTMINLDIQHVLLANDQGELRLSMRHLLDSGEIQRSLPSLEQWLTEQIRSGSLHFAAQPTSFQHIDGETYILAVAAVLRSDGSGDIRGYLLMVRRVDDSFWGALSYGQHLKIIASHNPPANCQPLYSRLDAAQQQHQRCLMDVFGRPSIMLTFDHGSSLPPLFKPAVFGSFLVLALLPSLLFFVFLKAIITPIVHATNHLRDNRRQGEFSPIRFSAPFKIKELVELKNSYNAVVQEINRQKSQLLEMSNTDRLTGIHNRRYFDEALLNTWQRLQRHSDGMALVLCDIDYFKRFNDHYGHIAGDEALRLVAQALSNCARRADELTARYGGEEFILITYVRNHEELFNLQQRIKDVIAQLHISHGFSDASDHLTLSAGIAWIPSPDRWLDSLQPQGWVEAADQALYEAKNSGRNRSVVRVINSPADCPAVSQAPQ